MDKMTSAQRSRVMQHIRSTNTKPEIMLRKALWHRGIRYRKNWRRLTGCPDIVLTRHRIAIFVDGDFWHARGCQDRPGSQIGTNKAYWQKKLARNVERDKEVVDSLTEQGWLVLRFWESDIKNNLDGVVREILDYV